MKRLPNALSASRFPLAVGVVLASAFQSWTLAWWMFALASMTDLVDGPLARRLGAVSDMGDMLDHRGDLVLVVSASIGLTLGGVFPPLTILDIIIGLAAGWLITTRRSGGASASTRRQQFAVGAIVFVGMLVVFNGVFLSQAYGWRWWYIAIGGTIVALIGATKRGRLSQ